MGSLNVPPPQKKKNNKQNMIKDGLINEILDISMIIFYSLFVNVLYFHPIFYIIYLNICFNQVNSTQDEPSALITIISIKNI